MEFDSRLHKGLNVLASLLHVKRTTVEEKPAAKETDGAMEDELDEAVDPEDDWDDDEDE